MRASFRFLGSSNCPPYSNTAYYSCIQIKSQPNPTFITYKNTEFSYLVKVRNSHSKGTHTHVIFLVAIVDIVRSHAVDDLGAAAVDLCTLEVEKGRESAACIQHIRTPTWTDLRPAPRLLLGDFILHRGLMDHVTQMQSGPCIIRTRNSVFLCLTLLVDIWFW